MEVTRRDVLRIGAVLAGTAGGAALLSACTGGGQPAPTEPGGPEDPDRGLRAEIGRSEAALIALYAEAAPRLSGEAAARVAALGERHPAYRQAIDPDRLAEATPTAADGSTPSTVPSASATASLPADQAAVLAALVAAETAAAEERARQSVAAVDGELARVIVLAGSGSAAAAEALGRVRA